MLAVGVEHALLLRGCGRVAAAALQGVGFSTKSRFFETVHVKEAGDQYEVLLDKRVIKTPGQKLLQVPSRALALAIAAEWEWQTSNKPQLHSMPLMSLAATAIDQPKAKNLVIDNMLKYLHTDSACCRYEPGPLANRQSQVFGPLLQWAEERLGLRLQTSDSIYGPTQSAEDVQLARNILHAYDQWQLAAADQVTAASKSLVVALAVVEGRLGMEEAVEAARVEEEFQLRDWGRVEAAHDLDVCEATSRVAGAHLFLRLLRHKDASTPRAP